MKVQKTGCTLGQDCVPQCTEPGCVYLCRHMVDCSCPDFLQGHLCKHAHKIKSKVLQETLQPLESNVSNPCFVTASPVDNFKLQHGK